MRVSAGFRNLLVLACVYCPTVFAQTAQGSGYETEGSVSVGYVGTTGNTETQTVESSFRYVLDSDTWVHGFDLRGLYTERDAVTSGERYFAQAKTDYKFEEEHYAFGKLSYTDDRFTGFDYQATASFGYGHYFFNREDLMLEAFAGVGYRYNAVRVEDPANDLQSEGEAVLSLGENFEWELSDSTRIVQSLTTEIGEDLTVSRFNISLVSNLIGELATKIAFQAQHISDVPPDRENFDTQTSVSLVYEF